jgi:hypothetical protein
MSRRKKIVVAVIATTVLGIAAASCAETPETKHSAKAEKAAKVEKAAKADKAKPKTKSEMSDAEMEAAIRKAITAEMIVDMTFAKPGAKRQFCEGYNALGIAGLAAFKAGYTEKSPSAREVYIEAGSRC